MIFEAIRLALRSVLRNKLRSFLTILGVVIGVAAVIAMVTVGQGSSVQVNQSVSSMGANMISLHPGGGFGPRAPGSLRRFSLADADALADLPAVRLVAPTVSASVTAVYGSANKSTFVTGSTETYLEVSGWTLASGRNFNAAEGRSNAPLCIIGQTVNQTLFGGGNNVGEIIRVKSISCEVIGILSAKGASSFGQDQDDIIVMPIAMVQRRLNGTTDVNAIQIGIAPSYSSAEAIVPVQNLMRERRSIPFGGADDFSVRDAQEIASMLNSVNAVLSGLLSSVAAVSLLVGGIGIMNIMLVSVTERTREIGIRLAIGATASQVLTQFLIEAVVLSLIGGILGIFTGLVMAWGAGLFMGIPFSPSLWVIAMAFAFSALVGVIFGYFPARRAAQLDPIEALRHQ